MTNPTSNIPKSDYLVPVLFHETMEHLNIHPNGVYVDATFGGGGHSRGILSKLGPNGRLIAFDQDEDAKKNLVKVPIMHGTIPHDQLAKAGAAKVLIKPAAHGAGVIAGGSMRAVLESAGITDVLAKSLGSANPHNVVKATIKALTSLREPIQVAKTRHIKLSKVFNG